MELAENRAHFFCVAAQAMRHILVDYARARKMAKRGGGAHQVSLDEALTVGPERGDDEEEAANVGNLLGRNHDLISFRDRD